MMSPALDRPTNGARQTGFLYGTISALSCFTQPWEERYKKECVRHL